MLPNICGIKNGKKNDTCDIFYMKCFLRERETFALYLACWNETSEREEILTLSRIWPMEYLWMKKLPAEQRWDVSPNTARPVSKRCWPTCIRRSLSPWKELSPLECFVLDRELPPRRSRSNRTRRRRRNTLPRLLCIYLTFSCVRRVIQVTCKQQLLFYLLYKFLIALLPISHTRRGVYLSFIMIIVSLFNRSR